MRLVIRAFLAAGLCSFLACDDSDSTSSASCTAAGMECSIGELADELGIFAGGNSGDRGESRLVIDPEYAEALLAHHNSVTSENVLKWPSLSDGPGVYDFTNADPVVDFAEANDIRLRGHALFWGRLNGTPEWLAEEVDAADDPQAALRERMEQHVTAVMGRYRGRIHTWDVVNEPLTLLGTELDPEYVYTRVLGREYIDLAFRLAREADPDALLFLNETSVSTFDSKFEALLALVEDLLEDGVPIDGVGLQGHLFARPSRAGLVAKLRAIESLGLVAEFTELDITVSLYPDEQDPFQAQAEDYAAVFGACVEVPACIGVTTWGIHDDETWLDSFIPAQAPHLPLMLDRMYQPKPAYEAVRSVLSGAIRSDSTG